MFRHGKGYSTDLGENTILNLYLNGARQWLNGLGSVSLGAIGLPEGTMEGSNN